MPGTNPSPTFQDVTILGTQTGGGGGAVTSVAGRTGVVTLAHTDITDWTATLAAYQLALGFTPYNATNPSGYQTAANVASAIAAAAYSLPTASTSILGGVKIDGTTVTISGGVISASGVASGVASFNTRSGAITLSSADVTTALTFTPYNATNPSGFIAAAGAPVQSVAGRVGAVVIAAADVSGLAAAAAAAAPVQSVATRSGAITLTHSDLTDWASATSGFGGAYTLPTATASVLGGVKPDGTTLANTAGVISVAYGTAANTAAQGNDTRITGAQTAAQVATAVATETTRATTAEALLAPKLNPTFTGPSEVRVAMAANNIDCNAGSFFTKTISGATTLTVSNVPAAGTVPSFLLILTNGGSAAITWWSGMHWPGGTAPTLTVSGRDVLGFYTLDGGTTWDGFLIGKGQA